MNKNNTFIYSRLNVKERVKLIKQKLPKHIKKIIITNYPEYNSVEGCNLINNVLALKSPDLRLCEILEKIVSDKQKGL